MSSSPRRLMAHLIAGFPDLESSDEVAQGLIDGGSEFIEVQFPYSDPTADGAAIQTACERALRAGFRLDEGLRFVSRLCSQTDRKIFVMSYAGMVVARGVERFLTQVAETGVEGVIVPDLMPGYDEGLYEIGTQKGLAVVPVIAPSISDDRLEEILALRTRFLYAAIRTGITGSRSKIDTAVAEFLKKTRRDETTLIAGFGIAEARQAERLQPLADVLVVGSAFVRRIIGAAEARSGIRNAVGELAAELSGRKLRFEEKEATD